MAANAPAFILISSTIPSNVSSRLYRFLNVTCPPAAGMARDGLTNWSSAGLVSSVAKASFGALLGAVVEVTQSIAEGPVAVVVQPTGSAGALTPSKFSVKLVVALVVPSWKL